MEEGASAFLHPGHGTHILQVGMHEATRCDLCMCQSPLTTGPFLCCCPQQRSLSQRELGYQSL